MKKKTVDSLKQNPQGIGFYVRENISKVCLCRTNIHLSDQKPIAPADSRGIHSEVVNPKIKTHEK